MSETMTNKREIPDAPDDEQQNIRKTSSCMDTPRCEAAENLKRSISKRQASLLPCERIFLSNLLIDHDVPSDVSTAGISKDEIEARTEMLRQASLILDDDTLFSTPFNQDAEGNPEKPPIVLPHPNRSTKNHVGLWKAYEEGASWGLKNLWMRRGKKRKFKKVEECKKEGISEEKHDNDEDETPSLKEAETPSLEETDANTVLSDEEVRGPPKDGDDDASNASSWNLSEGGFDHYDAWEVIKDEYAKDFGFEIVAKGSNLPISDDPDDRGPFKILGTSSDDIAAQPHVLSPPLMESLRSFIPEGFTNNNWWLKFSLRRDGADLEILKRYVRAATHTVMAIETREGDVFGCFTTSAWRTSSRYFGNGEAFLWRMRHNRMLPCHSLFEQAAMESEIDVFPYSGKNDFVQICNHSRIALGGEELKEATSYAKGGEAGDSLDCVELEEGTNHGFGLAINSDLLYGTSSPCATFRNPCLSKNLSRGDSFEIANLEVWTFTPCDTVSLAEKMEMTKFFVQESAFSSMSSFSQSTRHYSTAGGSSYAAKDFSQEEFYRRYGDNDEDELERACWQYQNMMDPTAGYGKPR